MVGVVVAVGASAVTCHKIRRHSEKSHRLRESEVARIKLIKKQGSHAITFATLKVNLAKLKYLYLVFLALLHNYVHNKMYCSTKHSHLLEKTKA